MTIDGQMGTGAVHSGEAWRFAIDRGGTFTDVVATTPGGQLVTDKLLSEDLARYSDAASEAVRRLMLQHGSGPTTSGDRRISRARSFFRR